jgi:hypothetical protein
MRTRLWWSMVLVAAVLLTTAPPSDARTNPRSPVSHVAAGCVAPKLTRDLNLDASDRLNDMSGMTSAGAAVVGSLAARAAVQQSIAAAAGETAAAAMAGESVVILGAATAGLGLAAAALWAGYYYYKTLKDDPPDPHFMVIDIPRLQNVALQPVPGLTAAETTALNALAANTRQLLAVSQSLATTQNRATGAAAAGQAGPAQRQNDAAKVYALRLAGLLDAQPALLTRVRAVLVADDRFPAALQPGTAEIQAFQSSVSANGLPAALARVLREAGIDGPRLADFRTSIALVRPSMVAGQSYPDLLTDPRITAFDRSAAASWRKFAAGSCPIQRNGPPTPPPSGVTFSLQSSLTEVHKFHGNLTMDAVAKTAHVDQGIVTYDENWTIPDTLTPGKQASVTLGLDVTNTGQTPCTGCYNVGISVTAQGLNEQLLLDISKQLKGEKTYTWTIPEGLTSADDLTIQIHTYESSSIIYHYRK